MSVEQQESAARVVIYTSPGWFTKVCQAIQRSPSRRVDKALAETVGAKKRNSPQLLGAFRTLGFIDQKGSLTDRGRMLALGGDTYREAIAEGLRDVYGSLVQELASGGVSSTSVIARRLGDLSGAALGESARLQAARFLKFLVAESAVEDWVGGILPSQRSGPPAQGGHRRPRPRSRRAPKGRTDQTGSVGVSSPPGAQPTEHVVALRLTHGTARLQVPCQLTADDATRLKQQIDVFPLATQRDEE